jgi:hypothetical protein
VNRICHALDTVTCSSASFLSICIYTILGLYGDFLLAGEVSFLATYSQGIGPSHLQPRMYWGLEIELILWKRFSLYKALASIHLLPVKHPSAPNIILEHDSTKGDEGIHN